LIVTSVTCAAVEAVIAAPVGSRFVASDPPV
jgi:hypothetical protein